MTALARCRIFTSPRASFATCGMGVHGSPESGGRQRRHVAGGAYNIRHNHHRHRTLALVVGVANSRSLAWSSALSLLDRDFDVVVTYQNERMRSSVERLVDGFRDNRNSIRRQAGSSGGDGDGVEGAPPLLRCLPCDVADEGSVEELFQGSLPDLLRREGLGGLASDVSSSSGLDGHNDPRLDALVHSVAYAPPEAMKGGTLLTTSREAFSLTHEVSAYSLLLLARSALPMLSRSGRTSTTGGVDEKSVTMTTSSITALTYLGSTHAVPNYNVMGPAKACLEAIVRGLAAELGPPPHRVRVNCVSAGPVSTMAAKGGISGFSDMRDDCERRAPLRRNVTGREVGETVAFLADGRDVRGGVGSVDRECDGGGGSSGITGQTIYVDAGYSSVAGPCPLSSVS